MGPYAPYLVDCQTGQGKEGGEDEWNTHARGNPQEHTNDNGKVKRDRRIAAPDSEEG